MAKKAEESTAEKVVVKEVIKEVPAEPQVPSTDFLTNEIVTVQYIKRENANIKDPKHVGYGGLFEGSTISIPVPLMDSGKMKNILTKKEKAGLEYLLGIDLSIYKDFWRTEYKKGSLFPIHLGKDGMTLDKSDPEDYIRWKVLMASPIVANSIDEIKHKATYRFVLVEEGEEIRREKEAVGSKVVAYEKYVEYKNNKSVLRYILRNLGRHTSRNQSLDFLQIEASKQIEKDPALFVAVSSDKNIKSKVLLGECVEYGIVNVIDRKYYDLDNKPISGGESPSLDVAAMYLSSPLGQEMRLALEAKLKIAKA